MAKPKYEPHEYPSHLEHGKKEKLTKDEMRYLYLVMHHLTDYMSGDDRPDHGWGKLKDLREASDKTKREVYALTAKLWRVSK